MINVWMSEQLNQAHISDLHREAAAYRRLPARRDRAPRASLPTRLAGLAGFVPFHRRPTVVGCQA